MHTPLKHISKIVLALVILGFASLACNIDMRSAQDESSSTGQPDLVVSMAYASMTLSGECLKEYGPLTSTVCVQNKGDAPAGPFVLEVSDGTNWVLSGLDISETTCFDSDLNLSGAMVTADANNNVMESNEDNNTLYIPVPTPPVLCTPAPESVQLPTVTMEPTPETPDVSYRGVSFSFDEYWFEFGTPETIPAEVETAIESWNNPEYFNFTFSGYPLNDTFHQPRIMVFPVETYRTINSVAGDIINQLEQFLINKTANPENIPFLPVFNTGQFMRTQVKYIEFQNGSGVRFLTQYGQAAWPINNQDMFYTFQGLTSDGDYYFSAIFPVSHPDLPHPDVTTMDEAFYENFMDYAAGVEDQLNAQTEKDFFPPLLVLDNMIQSLSVIGAN